VAPKKKPAVPKPAPVAVALPAKKPKITPTTTPAPATTDVSDESAPSSAAEPTESEE
jgi:hypothetical protein